MVSTDLCLYEVRDGVAVVTLNRPERNNGMYHGARTLRIADGPDEVHKVLIAKNVIGAYEKGDGWDFGN